LFSCCISPILFPNTFCLWTGRFGCQRGKQWLNGKNTGFYKRLIDAYKSDGKTYGSNFDRVWKEIAKEDREGFLKLQRDYAKLMYYDAAVLFIKSNYGLDVNTRSAALQNVIWSTAIQHGPTAPVFGPAISAAGGKTASDLKLINAIYDERSKVDRFGVPMYFYGCKPDVQQGVLIRFANERQDALNMLNS
jgi:hypothetical protein